MVDHDSVRVAKGDLSGWIITTEKMLTLHGELVSSRLGATRD